MATPIKYGLQQARIKLTKIVTNAYAGQCSIITKHGKPCAAIVPLADLPQKPNATPGFLSLKGSGRGFWGANVGQTIESMRNDWE